MKTTKTGKATANATALRGETKAKRAAKAVVEQPASGYHHGNLRAALIEAGLQALEEGERAELSLRDLARRAGVSANAAYHHFENKEALLSALAAEGFRRLHGVQQQAPRGKAGREAALRAVGRAYVQFAMDHPALFRLMYGGFTASHNDVELVDAAMSGFDAVVSGIAAFNGRSPQDPEVMADALLLWSIVHGLAHLALGGQLGYFGPDPGALVDTVLSRSPLPR